MTDTSALSILRETKVLSEDDLARLAADPDAGGGLVAAVVRLGIADEEKFLRAAAPVLGVEYRDVEEL